MLKKRRGGSASGPCKQWLALCVAVSVVCVGETAVGDGQGVRWCTFKEQDNEKCRLVAEQQGISCILEHDSGQCQEAVCKGRADFLVLESVQPWGKGVDEAGCGLMVLQERSPCFIGVGQAIYVRKDDQHVVAGLGSLFNSKAMMRQLQQAPQGGPTPSPGPTTPAPTTPAPTTPAATTPAPTTPAPATPAPTTPAPTTPAPTTPAPATPAPTTPAPTTPAPTTPAPTTPAPTTPAPTTPAPTTPAPTTPAPTTPAPTTPAPTTSAPTTFAPTTPAPTTPAPVTPAPATPAPTIPVPPVPAPTTPAPTTPAPITAAPAQTATAPATSTPLVTATPAASSSTPLPSSGLSSATPFTTTPSLPLPTTPSITTPLGTISTPSSAPSVNPTAAAPVATTGSQQPVATTPVITSEVPVPASQVPVPSSQVPVPSSQVLVPSSQVPLPTITPSPLFTPAVTTSGVIPTPAGTSPVVTSEPPSLTSQAPLPTTSVTSAPSQFSSPTQAITSAPSSTTSTPLSTPVITVSVAPAQVVPATPIPSATQALSPAPVFTSSSGPVLPPVGTTLPSTSFTVTAQSTQTVSPSVSQPSSTPVASISQSPFQSSAAPSTQGGVPTATTPVAVSSTQPSLPTATVAALVAPAPTSQPGSFIPSSTTLIPLTSAPALPTPAPVTSSPLPSVASNPLPTVASSPLPTVASSQPLTAAPAGTPVLSSPTTLPVVSSLPTVNSTTSVTSLSTPITSTPLVTSPTVPLIPASPPPAPADLTAIPALTQRPIPGPTFAALNTSTVPLPTVTNPLTNPTAIAPTGPLVTIPLETTPLPLPTVPLPAAPLPATTTPEPTTPLPLPPPPPSPRASQCATCPPGRALRPLDTSCDCVLPMIVNFDVSTGLNDFLNLVTTFVQQLSAGLNLNPAQVSIIGLSTVPATVSNSLRGRKLQQAATSRLQVETWLLPLKGNQLNATEQNRIVDLLSTKTVYLDPALFGNYTVGLILRPGQLPPPPPPGTAAPAQNLPGSSTGSQSGLPSQGLPNSSGSSDSGGGLGAGIIVLIVLLSVAAVGVCLGGLYGFAAWRKKQGKGDFDAEKGSPMKGSKSANSFSPSDFDSGSLDTTIPPYSGNAREFTYQELEKATNDFSHDRILGEGGFGQVFKGTLPDGTELAVKRLTRQGQQGHKEFLAEVEMLSRLHHRHLVQLLGFYNGPQGRLLAYELVPNGSVESHLHGPDRVAKTLEWESRVKIALGAARGLAYLHEDSNPRVIHRDFKASNILLTHDYIAKVSDFGLAKAAPDTDSGHISTRVMGTFGYVAPEYAMTGHLLVKSDVYSYGVVLLELLSGRKPVDMRQPPGQENLVTYARPLLTTKEGLEKLIDPSLEGRYTFDDCARVAAIASMCVQPEVSHRPFMVEVVQALKVVYQGSEVETSLSSANDIIYDDKGVLIRRPSQDLTNTGLSGEFAAAAAAGYASSTYDGEADGTRSISSGVRSGPQSTMSGPVSMNARSSRQPSWAKRTSVPAPSYNWPLRTSSLGRDNGPADSSVSRSLSLQSSGSASSMKKVDPKLGLGPGEDHSGEMEYEDASGLAPVRRSWA